MEPRYNQDDAINTTIVIITTFTTLKGTNKQNLCSKRPAHITASRQRQPGHRFNAASARTEKKKNNEVDLGSQVDPA